MVNKALVFFSGVIALILGILFIFIPENTLIAYIQVLGIMFVIFGGFKLFVVFKDGNLFLNILSFITMLVLGLLLIFYPIKSVFDILYFTAIFIFIQAIINFSSTVINEKLGFNNETIAPVIMFILTLIIIFHPFVLIAVEVIIPYIMGFGLIYMGLVEMFFANEY